MILEIIVPKANLSKGRLERIYFRVFDENPVNSFLSFSRIDAEKIQDDMVGSSYGK